MITLIKAKLKKSDDQTNVEKYRVDANVTEYHIISKIISKRIIIPKFMIMRQLFHLKKYVNLSKINIIDEMTVWSQLKSCYAFYIIPNCIRILSLKSIG